MKVYFIRDIVHAVVHGNKTFMAFRDLVGWGAYFNTKEVFKTKEVLSSKKYYISWEQIVLHGRLRGDKDIETFF